jgi:hypothetical protein
VEQLDSPGQKSQQNLAHPVRNLQRYAQDYSAPSRSLGVVWHTFAMALACGMHARPRLIGLLWAKFEEGANVFEIIAQCAQRSADNAAAELTEDTASLMRYALEACDGDAWEHVIAQL